MFIYKSKPRFHRFYEHNQLHIQLETHSFVLNSSFQAVWDYIKIILIFDFATLTGPLHTENSSRIDPLCRHKIKFDPNKIRFSV